jgi:hypothetical protein
MHSQLSHKISIDLTSTYCKVTIYSASMQPVSRCGMLTLLLDYHMLHHATPILGDPTKISAYVSLLFQGLDDFDEEEDAPSFPKLLLRSKEPEPPPPAAAMASPPLRCFLAPGVGASGGERALGSALAVRMRAASGFDGLRSCVRRAAAASVSTRSPATPFKPLQHD